MMKTQKTKMPSNAKCLFFCIFNISKLKMHGLKSNLIYSPTVYKKRQLKKDTKQQNTQPSVQGQ
jgi:hypothetical protein